MRQYLAGSQLLLQIRLPSSCQTNHDKSTDQPLK
jgi:hypothetical protein